MKMPSNQTYSTSRPSKDRLVDMMAGAGIKLTHRQADQFWTYHQYLRERNEALNMTRIYEFDAMVVKLYIDSAIVGELVDLPDELLDIGTGPGFPGLPLAILHPQVHFLLSEGRHQRNQFLRECVDKLGLKNVEVLGHRIAPDYERQVGGVVTRAVETIPETLQRVLRCTRPGARIIFMKGPECEDELRQAEKYQRWYGLTADIPYRLLDTDNRRRLVVYERNDVPAPRPVETPPITSADNARFRTWKTLLTTRGIRKEGLSIAGGKAALEILQHEPDAVDVVLLREGMKTVPEATGFPALALSRDLFAMVDAAGTNLPLVIVKVPTFDTWKGERDGLPDRCVLLDLKDPGELGAAVRSAVRFGVPDVVLLAEAAHPFHPRALQAAGATALQARYLRGPAVNDLPPGMPGGVHLAGPADRPAPRARLLLSARPSPWPQSGVAHDLEVEPGALLAATLAKAPS